MTSNHQVRVLVAARVSRGDKGASRVDRDDEQARQEAVQRGDVVVHTTEDRNVSGSIPPWERPQLGPWLTDPDKVNQYDEILASSIDRLGRNARDLNNLKAWADDHGKRLRVLKPTGLVWPVPSGIEGLGAQLMWALLGELAEIERKQISERTANARRTIHENEALAGKPPWGYLVIGSEKYAKTLAPDPALRPYLEGMVDRALRGDTLLSICRWLDAEGISPRMTGKPVRGGTGSAKWSPVSVSNALRNPALKGVREEKDAKGRKHTVLRFDSILAAGEWKRLQKALDGRPRRRGPTTERTAVLTNVIECEACELPMYRLAATTKRKDGTRSAPYVTYRCKGTDKAPSTCCNSVPLDDIEQWVNAQFKAPSAIRDDEGNVVDIDTGGPFGSVEIIETTTIPGENHQDEADEVEVEIRELDIDAPDYIERVKALRDERVRLLALPSEPSQVIERGTGRTVGDVWLSLDDEARRAYLLAAGVKVHVLSNAALRAQPGREIRYIDGDPHKVIGTLQGITATDDLK